MYHQHGLKSSRLLMNKVATTLKLHTYSSVENSFFGCNTLTLNLDATFVKNKGQKVSFIKRSYFNLLLLKQLDNCFVLNHRFTLNYLLYLYHILWQNRL